MAEPKKRTLQGVYDGLKQISNEEGIDFGIDNYTYEQFKDKYKTPQDLLMLYNNLSDVSDEYGLDFGIGDQDEWLGSFGDGWNDDGANEQSGRSGATAAVGNDSPYRMAQPNAVHYDFGGEMPATRKPGEQQQQPKQQEKALGPERFERQMVMDAALRQRENDFHQRMENMRRGNQLFGSRKGVQYNPTTQKFEDVYYTKAGEAVGSELAQRQRNAEVDEWWENNTEEGRKVRDQKRQQVLESRLDGLMDEVDPDNTAEAIWEAADRRATERQAKTARSAAYIFSNAIDRSVLMKADRMTEHDLQRMADEAWNALGSDRQQQIIDEVYRALLMRYEGYEVDDNKLYPLARQIAREQSDRRMYDLAVAKNAPQSATENFIRKAISQNMLTKLIEAGARVQAGTSGDMAARDQAMLMYEKDGHKLSSILGTVSGMVVDPLTWIGGATAKGVIGGGMWLAGKKLGEAAVRKGASTLAGRLFTGAVGGGVNFATFEAGGEALEQMRYGGSRNAETGEVEGYDVGAVLGQASHGALLGTATGVLGPMLGNVSDKLVGATGSTAGKLGIRAGELAVGTVAEGTIFSIPEWISGKRDAMDVWTDNLAMIAGFKAHGLLKSARQRIAELRRDPRSKAGFETRLRSVQDGRGDLALTADEKRELNEGGYGDLAELVEEYNIFEATRREYGEAERNADRVEPGRQIGARADAELPYNRFAALMNDAKVSEAARAKMYYYLTGRMLPMSTVMGSVITEHTDDDGKVTGYTVNAVGANGTITSRTFDSKEKADIEVSNINRQAELNGIDVGERYTNWKGENLRMYEACKIVSEESGPPVSRLMELMKSDPTQMNSVELEWAERVQSNYDNIGNRYSADALRAEIGKQYGVDVDKAIAKEPKRRTDAEQEAVEEYAKRLFDGVPREEAAETAQEKGYNASPDERRDIMMRLAMNESNGPDELGAADGMRQRIEDDADMMVAEQREQGAKMRHSDGTFRPAVLKEKDEYGNDKMVYIVDGDVVMNEDGTMVDRGASDRSVVVYDPATGERRMIDPTSDMGIHTLGEVVTAEQYEQELQEMRAAYVREQMDAAQGTVRVEPGREVTMQGDTKGKVVAVDGENVTVETGDGQQVTTTRSELQRFEDERAMADYRKRHPEGSAQDGAAPEGAAPEGAAAGQPRERPTEQAGGRAVEQAAVARVTAGVPEVYEPGMRVMVKEEDGKTGKSREMEVTGVRATWKPVTEDSPAGYVEDANGKYVHLIDVETGRPEYIHEDKLRERTEGYVPKVEEGAAPEGAAAGQPRERPTEQAGGRAVEQPSMGAAEEDQPTIEPMPMRADGEADFMATTPERGHQYVYNEAGLSREEAGQFVKANIDAAEKELSKLKGKAPKIGTSLTKYQQQKAEHQQQVEEAQRVVDYWNGVRAEQQRIVAAERAERDRAAHDAAVQAEQERQAAELAKRQEQAERGAGVVHPAIREKWENAPKVEGVDNEITLANGERVKGRYMLVDSGAATPSHNPNMGFARNEGFPIDENGQTVNDRDYERDQEAQTITRQMAERYDSRAIQSVPVVSNDGVVLSGNGRTMAGELAAQNDTDGAYIEHLRKYPQQFGFTPEQVEAFIDGANGSNGLTGHPRVVFVPDEAMPYTTDTFAKFNAQDMKSQSRTEQAVKLGKTVADDTFGRIVRSINSFDTLGDFYNDPKAAPAAIGELHKAGVINQMQIAEMMDGEKISGTGRQMLECMLIGKAFESNPDAVRQLAEFPAMRQSVVSALAELANNIKLGEDYTLEGEMAQAINLAYQARKSGIGAGEKVSPFARQQNLFPFEDGETVADYTNAAMLMLADCLNDGRVSQLKKVIALYNDHAAQSAAGQYDIFSGGVKSKEDIIKEALNILNNGTKKEQQEALAGAAERRKEAAGVQQDGAAGAGDAGSGAQSAEEVTPQGNKSEGNELSIENRETNGETERDNTEQRPDGGGLREQPAGEAQGGSYGVDIMVLGAQLSAEQLGDYEKGSRAEQEEVGHRIIENAKRNGVFIDRTTHKDFGERVKGVSGESVVYVDEANNRVVKVKDPYAKSNLKGHAASDALYEHIVHNLLFPNTQYRLIGISDDVVGDVRFVLEQDYMKDGYIPASQADIDRYLTQELGLTKVEKPYLHYENDYYSITDVDAGSDNVLVDENGAICFIDPIIKFKKPAVEVINYINTSNAIAAARADVDTDPTEGQKKAGNYKKGHVKLDGYDITIENPKGSKRRGTDPSGKSWEQEMHNDYGYIKGTVGFDKDHLDIFLSDDPTQGNVYVVDQVKEDGKFDEHKIMYGFPDIESARKAYLSNYEEGWQGLGAITPVSKEEFKKWVGSSKRKMKPFSEYRSVETLGDVQLGNGVEGNYGSPVTVKAEAPYSIIPTQYTTKKGKVLDVHLVKFADELTSDQKKAASELNKELRGWWSREDGGYLMRSEDDARRLVETLTSEEGVADAQPLSLSDMAEATDRVQTEREKTVEDSQEQASSAEEEREPTTSDSSYGADNKFVSRDRYEELKERMRKKLLGQMNLGVDPEIIAIGTEMAVFHIEAGARKFADYAKKMIKDLGDAIRPYLKAFYNGVRDMPETAAYRKEFTTYDEVERFDVENFDKEGAKDIIKTAETITREQEVKREVAEGTGKLKAERNEQRKSIEAEMKGRGLRRATVEELEGNPLVFVPGSERGERIMLLTQQGEQMDGGRFSKPVISSVMLTDGKSYKPDELWVKAEESQPRTSAGGQQTSLFGEVAAPEGAVAGQTQRGKAKPKAEAGGVELVASSLPEDQEMINGGDNGLNGTNGRNGQVTEKVRRAFSNAVTSDMLAALERGEKPYRSIVDLRKRAESIGMTVDADGRDDILLQELVEDGLVRAARQVVENGRYGGRKSREAYEAICRLYELQPTIAQRSSNRIKMQQYSTPLPMAFVADMFAWKPGTNIGLEPTAGNGMLVFGVPAGDVVVNELDKTRLANLQEQGFLDVKNLDALTADFGGTFDFVIANPPFGSAEAKMYDGKEIAGLDPQITLNALAHMKPKGRAAIIIGGNMEYAPNGSVKDKKPFWTYLYNHYNVKGVVDMDGKLYAKQGTTYPTRMILIDGVRSDEERVQSTVYPPKQENAVRKAETFEDLYDIVNEIINTKEKTNGTEVLRTGNMPVVPDTDAKTGRTNTVRTDRKPDADADDGRNGGTRPTDGSGGRSGNRGDGQKRVSAPTQTGRGGVLQSGDAGVSGSQGDNGGRPVSGGEPGRGERGGDTGRVHDAGVRRDGDAAGGIRLGEEAATMRRHTQQSEVKPRQHTETEKRSFDEEKLPYRPHSSAFSLESVAPAAMVEAMDNTLSEIEKTYGQSVDQFVTKQLGYDSEEEMHQALAAEQVDSVAMALHQMSQGNALIIGDQTGVGKGRQMAALIRWAVRAGKKPIFITQKADLFSDIYRDLVDVGSGDLRPFIFNSDGAIVDSNGAVVHKPLSSKEQAKIFAEGELPEDYDFAVLTYSQVNTGDRISRKTKGKSANKENREKAAPKADFLRQIARDNYLFLDECHTAAGDSNIGAYIRSIIGVKGDGVKAVTFASATFAKRPDTMPMYALRTAMSQANVEPDKLISIIEKGGVTLQEIMSRALTESGQMVRRERDMSDVRTDWETVSDPATVKRARDNYDKTIEAFNAIIKFQEDYVKPMIQQLDAAISVRMETANVKRGTNKMGVENVPFASKTYNYTKQLMLALKADAIVDRVEQEIKAGRHPVIALESTMEASLKDYAIGEAIDEPTFSASLLKGLDNCMQYTIKDEDGKETHRRYKPSDLGPEGEQAYYQLQDLIRESTKDVFISPLDAIIEMLHARGYKVGELTGRNLYAERDSAGRVIVKRRTDRDKKRMQREFNSGALDVLILNKSASTGISLHASSKFSDQRQRSMIIAQPLSDINDYMQMIGRIDRTGQVARGYYINLGLPVPAESRFMMMLSTKLKSLNANTTTSQDSESSSVDAPDLLNKYGSQVVVEYLRDNPSIYTKMGDPLNLRDGKDGEDGKSIEEKLEEVKPGSDDAIARKITGYVALLSTAEQEAFYKDVVQRYTDLIKYLDSTGTNDLKITVMPLRAKTLSKRVSSEGKVPDGNNPFAGNAYVEQVEMDVLRKPMKAEEVRKLIEQMNTPDGTEKGHFATASKERAVGERVLELVGQVQGESEAKLRAEEERYEASKQKAEEEIERWREKINGQNRTAAEKAEAINNKEEEINGRVERRHTENVNIIKAKTTQLVQMLQEYRVGDTYLLPQNMSEADRPQIFKTPAIFCGYKVKKSGITPSTSFAVFATLDGRRRIEVKFTDNNAVTSIGFLTEANWDETRRITLDNWDSQIPTESRKKGYIMTGNILQAVADTQDEMGGYPGQLISYSDEEGNIHDGILMPDSWEPTKLRTSGVPIEGVMGRIRRYDVVESQDGKIKLYGSEYAKRYFLEVPKTKKEGADYFDNHVIVRATEGGTGFYPYRGKLRADIPARNIDAVIKELGRLGVRVKSDEEESGRRHRMVDVMHIDTKSGYHSASDAGVMEPEGEYGNGVAEPDAREIGDALNERLVYPENRTALEKAVRELSLRHNREVYPEQPVLAAKVRQNSESAKNDLQTAENESGVDGLNVVNGRDGEGELFRLRDGESDKVVDDAEKRRVVEQMGEKLHIADKVIFVESADELDGQDGFNGSNRITEEDRRSKGWYDVKTGKIVIVLDNHTSSDDVIATLLHEGVAHYGLRQLFGKHFDEFLDNVYASATEEVRGAITNLAADKYGWNIREATEEYMAGLAEDTDFENPERQSWWTKIKQFFWDMLHKLGIAGQKIKETISDNELRYLLWRSYQNLVHPGRYRSFVEEAEDVVMQDKLKVGDYGERSDEREEVIGGRSGQYIEAVNAKFNEELERLTEENAREVQLDCGRPGEVLLSCGVEDKPIRLYGGKLMSKAKKHGYRAKDIKDLPKSLQRPIAVFKGSQDGSFAILTELQIGGNNVLASLTVGKGGHDVDFNIITSVYGKEGNNVVRWINDGKMLYADKDKALGYISVSAPIAEAQSNQELFNSAAKIVKKFDNPQINLQDTDKERGGSDGRGSRVPPRRYYRDGDFSPRDNAIERDYYERMVSQNSYQVQEALQDSMLGLRKAMQAILGAGKDFKIEEVAGNENAFLAENRMGGTNASEQHIYFRQWMEPLLKAVHEIAGSKAAKREALTNYMMAKHGLERNEKFAERDFVAYQQQYPTGGKTLADFRQNDYAGLTALTGEQDVVDAEAVAQQMVADYESQYDTSELWDAVNTATKVTLAKMYRGGLLSKDSYEHTRDMFEYYIPLRGFDETTSDEVYGYLTSRQGPLGSSILKHAEGRRSKADDPIATIAMMADQAIVQANRNEMKQLFLTFVQNHPSDLVSVSKLWLQYDAAADEWVPVFADIDEGDTAADVARKVEAFEQRMEQLAANDPDNYKSGKEAASIPYRVLPGNMNEHQVLVKRAGETFVLTINGNPRAAQALNGLTNPDVKTGGFIGGFMKASSTVNRFLSSAYTTRTPDFVVSNFFRDMLYSNCMAWVKDTPSYALRFHKNFGRFNPVTMRVLFGKWENGKLDDSKSIEYMFKQFMMNGGETGYTNVRDIEAQKRRIVKELRRQGSAPRKVLHVLGEQLDLVNQAVENCARFAAFITSQELGRSIERSIYDAKEVSVNFNKKGSGDKMMGAKGQTKIGNVAAFLSGAGRCLQVFWNAGVQGMTNFGRAAKRKSGKFAAASATMFTLGAVIPLIAKALAGDGDDDDKNAYYNLPEYVRRSNICFRVGDAWITIPLPIEFRAIYGLGELGTGVITGEEHYSDGELARQMVAQVSQILPLDFMEGQGGLHNLWPSWAKPIVEAHNNKGWTGLPIYRDTPFNQSDPEFTKVYKSADKHIVAASKWLNELTGGDDYKKGWSDVVNPAQVEYVLNGYFGGYFKVPNQLIKMTETATGNREFEWRNMMIANRLIKSGDERTAHRKLQNEYFKYKEEYEETKRLKKKYENAAEEGVVGYAEKVNFLNNSEEYARYLIFDEYRKEINDLYNLQKEETDEEQRKEYEAEYYQVMREMVDAMHEYERSKGK